MASNPGSTILLCNVCLSEVGSLVRLPCNCNVCPDCLYYWAKSYCEQNVFAKEIALPCPYETCRRPMSQATLLSLLRSGDVENINILLTKHYLVHQMDIRMCPQKGCEYGGIAGRLPRNCRNYVCAKCGANWIDESQVTAKEICMRWLNRAATLKNEFSSNFIKLFIGNYCPGCSTHIMKLEGCPHMVCSRCKYEFCWLCLGSYRSYTHEAGKICGLRVLFLFLLFLFPLSILGSKLGLRFPCLNFWFWWVFGIVKFIPLIFLEIVGLIGLPSLIINELDRRRHNNNFKCLILLFSILILLYIAYNFLLIYFNVFKTIWVMIIYGAALIAIGVAGGILIGVTMDKLSHRLYLPAACTITLLVSEVALVSLYFWSYYYPLIVLGVCVNVLLGLLITICIQHIRVPGASYRYGIRMETLKWKKRILVVLIILAAGYNSILYLYAYSAIFKLLVWCGLFAMLIRFWAGCKNKLSSGLYLLGLTTVGSGAYYQFKFPLYFISFIHVHYLIVVLSAPHHIETRDLSEDLLCF